VIGAQPLEKNWQSSRRRGLRSHGGQLWGRAAGYRSLLRNVLPLGSQWRQALEIYTVFQVDETPRRALPARALAFSGRRGCVVAAGAMAGVRVAIGVASPAGTGSDTRRWDEASAQACGAGLLIVVAKRAGTGHSPRIRLRRRIACRTSAGPTAGFHAGVPRLLPGTCQIDGLRSETAVSGARCRSSSVR